VARNDFSGTGTFNTDNVSYVGDDPTGIGYEEADVSFTPGVGYGSQNIDTGGQSTDGSSLSESGYQNAMGITPTNPFGYDNFFSRNFGVDPRNINYTQQYADAPGGAASYMKGLGNDKYTNTFANPRNLSSLPGYDSNQKEGVLREAITGAPFGSLFGNNAGVKTAFGEVAEQDREMPFGEAASRLGIGALNPLLGYGLSNLGTTEMKLKTDADYDFTKDPNDPRYISKGAFSGILDSVTGGGGSKVATTARDGLLNLADNVMKDVTNFFTKDGKAQAGGLDSAISVNYNNRGGTIEDIVTDNRQDEPDNDGLFDNSPYQSPGFDIQDRFNRLRDPMTEPSFMGKDNATINIEKLPLGVNLTREPTKFMDAGNSLATNPEGIAATSVNQNFPDPRRIPDLLRDQIKYAGYGKPSGEGIVSLPEASGLDNNVISAGESRGKELADFKPFAIPDVALSDTVNDYVEYKDGRIDFNPGYISGLENNDFMNFKRSKESELYDKKEAERQRNDREVRAALNDSIDIRGKPFESILEQKAADLEKRMIEFYNKNAPVSEGTPEAKIGEAFAEEERVLRNLMDQQRKSGPSLPLTANTVNLVENPRGEGFVLEQQAGMGKEITKAEIAEVMKLGYSESEAIDLLEKEQFSEKIGVRLEDLPPDLRQQYFLNTNLDYGKSDQKPFNVVY
tara:strand:- start:65 stop:2107 length:2043 start_codon:yes stop_codon:yes gene_type:complete